MLNILIRDDSGVTAIEYGLIAGLTAVVIKHRATKAARPERFARLTASRTERALAKSKPAAVWFDGAISDQSILCGQHWCVWSGP